MDDEINEPVLWLKESSTSPSRVGHSDKHGFQIIRGVPKGNPRRIIPPPLELKSLADISKTFPMISEAAQTEWIKMKEESTQGGAIVYEPPDPTFDWAKPL